MLLGQHQFISYGIAVCLRESTASDSQYGAYPDPDAELGPFNEPASTDRLSKETSFRTVLEHGSKFELDHHLIYHAHYELSSLHDCRSNLALAIAAFELVLFVKRLEGGPSELKGKYSNENALYILSM